MFDNRASSQDHAFIAARVRQNVLSAAIAAGLMLWYGFGVLRFSEGSGPFYFGDHLSIHTLRIGGIVMAFVAVLSLLGMRTALILDGAASVVIGVLFLLSGGLMLLGGGSGFLYLLFGVLFVVVGARNCREWAGLASAPRMPSAAPPTHPPPEPSDAEGRIPSLATRLRDRHRHGAPVDSAPQPVSPDAPPPTQPRVAPPSPPPPPRPIHSVPDPPPTAGESEGPPPEGFLASFAPDQDDHRDNT